MLGVLAWLALGTVATIWGTLKLVKWSLNAEEPEIRQLHVSHLFEVWKLFVFASLAVVLWPGLSSWATGAWHYLHGLIP